MLFVVMTYYVTQKNISYVLPIWFYQRGLDCTVKDLVIIILSPYYLPTVHSKKGEPCVFWCKVKDEEMTGLR